MIDIHSHILPGLDDGAKDLETSICMLKKAVNSNTSAIVATPHYYTNYFETNHENVIKEVEKLKNEIKNHKIEIEIYSGQEVFIDNHTVELFKRGIIKGLCDTNYMLVELPMENYSDKLKDIIYELRLLGVRPIIAHPERYGYIMDNICIINNFIEEGCLFQINTGSIIGIFGRTVEKTARKLIENGLCNFIASDAHTVNRRCTGLSDAIEIVKKINNSVAVDVQLNGQLLLMNERIIQKNNKLTPKKSFFNFLK